LRFAADARATTIWINIIRAASKTGGAAKSNFLSVMLNQFTEKNLCRPE
jgi:hypothetical protein